LGLAAAKATIGEWQVRAILTIMALCLMKWPQEALSAADTD
jgi:hypothetical protein